MGHPAMMKAIGASKKKNDRIDARKTADLVRCDLLPVCYGCQRDLAEALIAALRPPGAIIVYSSFEQTRIKALRHSFPDLAGPLEGILGRLVDLLPIVTECVYHPDFNGSFSIKKVLPALVPELSYTGLAVADGDIAIMRFARMARGEISGADIETTRRQLLEYCNLDTLAMVKLHDALDRMAF